MVLTEVRTADRDLLILAPVGRDARLIAEALAQHGIGCRICRDVGDLIRQMDEGVGALLLTEEVFEESAAAGLLRAAILRQPIWSDLPVILSCGNIRTLSRQITAIIQSFDGRVNLTLLERPMTPKLLINSVSIALRARMLQYERRRLDHERQILLDEIALAKDAAEAANRAKSEFLANMSHEIRTPLGAILGFTNLLKDPDLTARERQEFIATIDRNGIGLMDLINDILDLSKVEAGKLEVESIPVALTEILRDVTEVLAVRAKDKGLSLRYEVDSSVPAQILSDPTRLKQILINIVSNAVKFTSAGGVHVKVTYAADQGAQNGMLSFAVQDTGRGISPSERARLFRPFTQADASTVRQFGGTGLGLLLARQLAGCLGGNVELVASEVGQGSLFCVTIQAGDLTQTAEGLAASKRTSWHKNRFVGALAGMRLLIAEDAPDNQKLISYYLRSTGVVFEFAANGDAAVKAAVAAPFDVILMDLQMPVLDGYDATKELRRRGFQQPIVALTAHAMSGDRQKCLDAGFNDYLSKPIHPDTLMATLISYLGT